MQDAGNQHADCILPIEDNMPAVLHAAQAGADIITRPAQVGISGELLATRFQIVDVAGGLVCTPAIHGVAGDLNQIGFGPAGKTEGSHGLARLFAQLECLPDARKGVVLGNTASIPFVNRGP